MMKKFICIFIIFSLVTVITACGQGSTPAPVAEQSSVEAEVTPVTEEAASEVAATEEAEPEPSPEEIIEVAMNEGLDYYYARNGKTADNDKALEAFQKAADLDSADAYYYIGRIHDRAEEYGEAKSAYEKAIDLGNSMANLGLGFLYKYGAEKDGIDKNYDKAKELFEKAVADGCIEGNYGLGALYIEGGGNTDADCNKALEYYETALTGDETEWVAGAYDGLMEAYVGYYDEIDKDLNKVDEYASKYEELSKDWKPDYMSDIGLAYEYAEEYDNAIEWYEKKDTKTSLQRLGYMYSEGVGVEQDHAKAFEYFNKGADLGSSNCMSWIGWYYDSGLGVDMDVDKAIEWYEKAGAAGDGNGYDLLAHLYHNGEKIEKDDAKALEYAIKGADLGYITAMIDTGYLYENGYGTDVDCDKACEYYAKADYYGDKTAKENILNMLNSGKVDVETANKWMDYYYK